MSTFDVASPAATAHELPATSMVPEAPQSSVEFDNPEVALLTTTARLAPRYLAIATTTAALWAYLVVGELVLFGVPEGWGWMAVLGIGSATYASEERRLIFLTHPRTARQRVITLGLVALMALLALLIAMAFGTILPEPAVTALLLIGVGAMAFWRYLAVKRSYGALRRASGGRRVFVAVVVTVPTLFAIVALIARQ